MSRCPDVQCHVNLVGHMPNTSFCSRPSKLKTIFFLKNRLLNKMISKNQVNRKIIFIGKNALFLKSINNIL